MDLSHTWENLALGMFTGFFMMFFFYFFGKYSGSAFQFMKEFF